MNNKCNKCGAELKSGDKFCVNCGTKIEPDKTFADKIPTQQTQQFQEKQ